MPGRNDGQFRRGCQIGFAAKVCNQFWCADRTGPLPCRIPVRKHAPNLIQRALFHHHIEAPFDPVCQPVTVCGDQDTLAFPGSDQGGRCVGLPFGQSATGCMQYLPRTLDAGGISQINTVPCQRVQRIDHLCQAIGLAQKGITFGAYFGLNRWNIGQPLRQRGQIQPGSADDNQALPHQCLHILQPVAYRIAAIRRDMAVKRMFCDGFILCRRPGGQHAPAGPDLQRVSVHDHPALRLRDGQRQRGFATGGRACDQQMAACVDFIHSDHGGCPC